MAQSKYDTNQDGVCDAPECQAILAMTDREDPYPKQAALLIAPILEPIGLTLDVKELERGTMYTKCNDANSHAAICLGPAWGKDYPAGYTFGRSVVRLEFALGELLQLHPCSAPLPDQMKGWGYTT